MDQRLNTDTKDRYKVKFIIYRNNKEYKVMMSGQHLDSVKAIRHSQMLEKLLKSGIKEHDILYIGDAFVEPLEIRDKIIANKYNNLDKKYGSTDPLTNLEILGLLKKAITIKHLKALYEARKTRDNSR